MKEVFSAFGSEVFRPLVTLLLPGAIGLSSWFAMSLQRCPAVGAAVHDKPGETFVILGSLALFLGLVFEDVGSQLEDRLGRRCNKKKPNYTQVWYQYLRHAFKTAPVGESYVRAQVIRLKFELDTSVSLIVAAIGSLFVTTPGRVGVWLPVVFATYLIYEAWNSCKLLGDVREELMKGITVVG